MSLAGAFLAGSRALVVAAPAAMKAVPPEGAAKAAIGTSFLIAIPARLTDDVVLTDEPRDSDPVAGPCGARGALLAAPRARAREDGFRARTGL